MRPQRHHSARAARARSDAAGQRVGARSARTVAALRGGPVDRSSLADLQRSAGNAAVAGLVSGRGRVFGQAAEPVQRLVSSASIRTKAGAPKPVKRYFGRNFGSPGYNKILTDLDNYDTLSGRLWTGSEPHASFETQLLASLQTLVTDCETYIRKHRRKQTRVPTITEIRDVEAPAERKLVQNLANDPGYLGYDHTRPFGEAARGAAGAAKQPAAIRSVGITADATPATGHGMAVWVEVDMGRAPIDPDTSPNRNSVYGVKFEYWEDVDFPYDFVTTDVSQVAGKKLAREGRKRKQWNDVYAMQPEAATFEKTAPPIDIGWKQAVGQAKAGTLTGTKKIGIYDLPSIDAMLGRYAVRRLRFRITYRDARGTQHEMLAEQRVMMAGKTTPHARTYSDSVGNKIGHTDGPTGETPVASTDRIAPPDVNPAVLRLDVPDEARAALPAFRQKIEDDEAKNFVFTELDQISGRIKDEGTKKAAFKGFSRQGAQDDVTKPGTRYEIAGWNLVPYPQSGWVYKEYRLPSGGLLVAIVEGKDILKMYYTDNRTVTLTTAMYTDWAIRSFAEIPVQSVVPVPAAVSPAMLASFSSKKALVEYLQAHNGELADVQREYELRFGANAFHSAVADYLKELFTARGRSAVAYKAIRDTLPENHQLTNFSLNKAYTDLFGKPALDGVELEHRKRTGIGPQVEALPTDRMGPFFALLRANPGRSREIEENFNILKAPLKFGPFLFDKFKALLARGGKNKEFYKGILRDYGEYEYLLRPAYRELFGERSLRAVKQGIRTDKLNAAVPNPRDPANLLAEQTFLAAGPFTLRDFEPSPGGRFDAAYTPATGDLQITIRCAFDFRDYDKSQNPVGGATGTLATKTWDGTARTGYLTELKRLISTTWSDKYKILCERPGWSHVPVVTPTVRLVEVAKGQEQYLIRVNKGILAEKTPTAPTQQYLSPSPSEGGRSWVDTKQWAVELQEWDVKDKLQDPVFHRYLHTAEKTQHVAVSYRTDRERIGRTIAQLGTIAFRPAGTTVADVTASANLMDELKRQLVYSDFTKYQTLVVDAGSAPTENPALAAQRMALIKGYLTRLGYTRVQDGLGTLGAAQVKVSVNDDPAALAEYENRWSRLSAAHEAGHMLGLTDEYNPAASTKLTKRLISEGLMPPDTPADHLTGDSSSHTSTNKAAEADAFADLLEANDLSTPDFTNKQGAKTSSIMTAGMDVMAAHYVTLWEALTKMTTAHLDPMFWRIQA